MRQETQQIRTGRALALDAVAARAQPATIDDVKRDGAKHWSLCNAAEREAWLVTGSVEYDRGSVATIGIGQTIDEALADWRRSLRERMQ